LSLFRHLVRRFPPLSASTGKIHWARSKIGLARSNGSPLYSRLADIGQAEYGMFFIGLTAAVASSTFAYYAISHSDLASDLSAADRIVAFPKITHRDGETGMAEIVSAPHFNPEDPNIDMTTGSIPLKSIEQSDLTPAAVRDPDSTRSKRVDLHLSDYVLRQVVRDRVMVSNGNRAYWVRPGSILPGAGRVVKIERRGPKWTVVTAHGIIEDTRP
jgi:hypothetical protein